MKIPYFLSTERVVGSGHATFADTINRALRSVLNLSGFNPDGDFPGFNARRNPIGDGADVTGVVDSAAAIALAHTNATVAGLEFFPGTYLIQSNLTITKAIKIHDGAFLKPAAGVVVTISGPIAAGLYQWLDYSGGGSFNLNSNSHLLSFIPQWFGVKGDGVTDDSAALLTMTNAMPNFSSAQFSRGMQIVLAHIWPILGRTGLRFYVDQSLPADAVTNGELALTRFIWTGATGGIMIGNYNSGYISFDGFVADKKTASVFIDEDQFAVSTTSGSPNITIDGSLVLVAGSGPSFLNLLPVGTRIRLGQAGIDTTLSSASDGTHGVLAVNSTYSSTVTNDNTKSALSLGIGAPAPTARITTWGIYRRLRTLGGTSEGVAGAAGVRVAWTGRGNCDFSIVDECTFAGAGGTSQLFPIPQNGNSVGQAIFNVANARNTGGIILYHAPGASITTGTNAFNGFSVDTFSPQMDGARIRIEGAGTASQGPNATRAALDGYFHYLGPRSGTIFSDAGLTTPLNASATVNLGTLGHEPHFHIGQSLGTGFLIGPAQNSHHHKVYRTQFLALNVGIDGQAGSFVAHDCWSSDCELAVKVGNLQQLPSGTFNWNSENDRQHLFLQSGLPFTERGGRHYMGYVTPSDGFYKVLGALPLFRLQETRIEGKIPYDCAVFNFSLAGGSQFIVRSEANNYFDAYSTTEMGWISTSWPNASVLHSWNDLFNNPDNVTLPLDSQTLFTNDTSRANGTPVIRLGNRVYITSSDDTPPAAGTFSSNELSFWFTNQSGDRSPVVVAKLGDSSFRTYKLAVRGPFTLTDGALVAIDMSLGDNATLTSNQTAPAIAYPSNPLEGQELEIRIVASNAAGCAPTWNGFYKWAGGSAPVITIAQNKSRRFRFRYTGGILEELWHSSADIA